MSRLSAVPPRKRWLPGAFAIAVALAAATVSGCGGDPTKPKLGRVSGSVTYNGAPVTKGVVTFVPSGGAGAQTGQPATGEIGSDGSFRLTTFESGDGAVVGDHVVLVQSVEMDPSIEGGSMPIPDARGNLPIQPPKHLVPEKYSQTETSPLRFTVKEGSNTFEIELTD
ncbi:hypothetical protein [Tautonia sociabilis]|uniref:Carboxypeptidase regulatory-like domain-containing protein n=1 Tax=Tautonia sociabilis TaxID=2080755 RepID=A0A432MJJ0_9BACT|nr:hypothetical protein [Tautonia sociabilis]RUL87574.1 hypothetical protein TsocGM_11225 [Tautonia sociabilis]